MSQQAHIPIDIWTPINIGVGTISALASLYLLVTVFQIPQPNISLKCIKWLGILSLFQSLFVIISLFMDLFSSTREIFSILAAACMGCSLLWSTALAHYTCKMIMLKKKWNADRFYRFCCWAIVPTIACLAAFYTFFKLNYPDEQYSQFVKSALAFPVFVFGIIVSFVSYCRQMNYINKNYSKELVQAFDLKLRRLTLYPLVLVIAYMPVIILQNFAEVELSWVSQLVILLSNSVGIINALVFQYARNLKFAVDRQTIAVQIQDMGEIVSSRAETSSFSQVIEKSNTKILRAALND